MLFPVSVFARKIRLQPSAARENEGGECRRNKPLVRGAGIWLWTARNSIAIRLGNVRRDRGPGQSEMREIAVGLCPFVGNHDADFGRCRRNSGQIELRNNPGDFLEFPGKWLVLTIPSGHAPRSFLRRAKIRGFVKLFGRGVRVAPKINSNASGANAGKNLRAIVGGDPLG